MSMSSPGKGFLHCGKIMFNMSIFKISPSHVTLSFYSTLSSKLYTTTQPYVKCGLPTFFYATVLKERIISYRGDWAQGS